MSTTAIYQVLLILGAPLLLCALTTRIKRDGLASVIRRMAVWLYAFADALEIAQGEFRDRKAAYTANARLAPDRSLEVAGERL